MLYVPLGVLAATVTIPLASMLNGPVVNNIGIYWWYWLLPGCVSFVNAFNAVTTVLFDATVTDGSLLHLLDCLLQLWL
jgi:hypothetical protein